MKFQTIGNKRILSKNHVSMEWLPNFPQVKPIIRGKNFKICAANLNQASSLFDYLTERKPHNMNTFDVPGIRTFDDYGNEINAFDFDNLEEIMIMPYCSDHTIDLYNGALMVNNFPPLPHDSPRYYVFEDNAWQSVDFELEEE